MKNLNRFVESTESIHLKVHSHNLRSTIRQSRRVRYLINGIRKLCQRGVLVQICFESYLTVEHYDADLGVCTANGELRDDSLGEVFDLEILNFKKFENLGTNCGEVRAGDTL